MSSHQKNIFLYIAVLLMTENFLSAKPRIIDWKNSDFNNDSNPKWVKSLFEKNNDKIIRKKADISEDYIVFYAFADSEEISSAKMLAQIKAQNCCSDRIKNETVKTDKPVHIEITGMEPVIDFWQQLSDEGKIFFRYYTVYKIRTDIFEKNKEKLIDSSNMQEKTVENQNE